MKKKKRTCEVIIHGCISNRNWVCVEMCTFENKFRKDQWVYISRRSEMMVVKRSYVSKYKIPYGRFYKYVRSLDV